MTDIQENYYLQNIFIKKTVNNSHIFKNFICEIINGQIFKHNNM